MLNILKTIALCVAICFCKTWALYAAGVTASHAVVATASTEASSVGLEILQKGGNAVDAAVAVGFALGVVEPQSSGLGGGGFALIFHQQDKQVVALDFRERAPRMASANMYQQNTQEAALLSQIGPLSVAVPGQVAGLLAMHERYGKLPLKEVIAPAIKLAQDGFLVSGTLARAFLDKQKILSLYPSTVAVFKKTGQWPQASDRLKQPDLANTLKLIQTQGKASFYQGVIARLLVPFLLTQGGIFSASDLEQYQIKWRVPAKTTYRGHTVYTMPLPSSAGVLLPQLLALAETQNIQNIPYHQVDFLHFMIESMKRVYAVRARYLGDPAFVSVPVDSLLSLDYIKKIQQSIDLKKATLALVPEMVSSLPQDPVKPVKEPDHTTHVSIVDKDGNAVSLTSTINGLFGSGLVADKLGFFLNNEMDDFVADPKRPNLYGLMGGDQNAVAPKKTPLSSMSPTLVFNSKKELRYVLGSPGGSTIITTVFFALLHLIDYQMDVGTAVLLPRIHHQTYPDEVRVEPYALDAETEKRLTEMGHHLVKHAPWGNAQLIEVFKDGKKSAASDPRGDGVALGY